MNKQTAVSATHEVVGIETLIPHPDNYQDHPDDQLEHLVASLKQHGVYRNVVVTRDSVLLAGHGVVEAAKRAGIATLPIVRLDIGANDPQAKQLMIGDNEIGNLSKHNERQLYAILRQIQDEDSLEGTGWNEEALALLEQVARASSEIADFNPCDEWISMPEYDECEKPYQLVIEFTSPEERSQFTSDIDLFVNIKDEKTWSTQWPWSGRQDLRSVRFDTDK